MDLPLPHEVPEEVTKLGDVRAVFRSARGMLVIWWALGAFAVLLALALLAVVLVHLARRGLKGARFGGLKVLILIWVGLFSAAVSLFRKALQERRFRVYVCDDGLACVRDANVDTMRWDDVTAIRGTRFLTQTKNAVVSSPPGFVLSATGGRQLQFTHSIARRGELRRWIEEQTLPRMLPPTVAAFNGGTELGFGPVRVSRDGLRCGQDYLTWDLLERVELARGRLLLYDGPKLFGRFNITQIPNLHLLLALIEHASGRRPGEG